MAKMRRFVVFVILLATMLVGLFVKSATVIHHQRLNQALISAVMAGDVAAVSKCLEAGADPNCRFVGDLQPGWWETAMKQVTKTPDDNRDAGVPAITLLFRPQVQGGGRKRAGVVVIPRENLDMLRRLLDAGADPNASSQVGTPLSEACACGYNLSVDLLLAHGADIDARGTGTPLSKACLMGKLSTVELLLKHGVNVNAHPPRSTGALWVATTNKHSEIASLLRAHGARDLP